MVWVSIAAVVAVSAAVSLRVGLAKSEADLHALFEGPEEHRPPGKMGRYPRVSYDTTRYRPAPDTLDAAPATDNDPTTDPRSILRLVGKTVYEERVLPEFLTITYPPDGALFPPNLCAPFFEWSDARNDLWQVTLEVPARAVSWRFVSRATRWRVPDDVWREVVAAGVDADVHLRVKGVNRADAEREPQKTVHVSQTVRFRISADPVDNVVVYRLVAVPFVNMKTPDTFVRDVRSLDAHPFILGRRQYCINCHTFSSKSGRTGKLGIQVRYQGADASVEPRTWMAVCDLDGRKVTKLLFPFSPQGSTFLAWSPDGTKLALAAGHQVSTLPPTGCDTLITVQSDARLAVYDLATGRVRLVPGANEPGRLAVSPCWTPDGTAIVYASGLEGVHSQLARLDLMVVPWNDGAGGKPEPVPGASRNGRSNYYPHFSPDGRWFSFTQSDGGTFVKSTSDVWLMPADFSEPPRRLECNAANAADSWHSWSSNSRWIAFASKRDDGSLARVYFAHIDETGRSSLAVRLPLATEPLMSFNVPELVAAMPEFSESWFFAGLRGEREGTRIEWTDGAGDERREQPDRRSAH